MTWLGMARILAKPSPKKGKTVITETLHLVTNAYEDGNFSRQVPEKKYHVSVSKGVHNRKLCNLQKSLQLARIIYCFQRKTPKCKYWFLKVLCLETQMEGSCWLKNGSLCLRLQAYQNVVLLVDAMNWDLTYKDLIKKIVYNPESNKCVMHWCDSCPGIATLK